MRNHATERDPSRNANFSRRWADDPLQLPDLQHLGREVAPRIVEDVGRRAIGHWLARASGARGTPAAEAFRQADAIRERLGLEWDDLIEERSAA
jgi:hypothetical protein